MPLIASPLAGQRFRVDDLLELRRLFDRFKQGGKEKYDV